MLHRVLTVQEVLATVTNIQVQDQILICGGRPLEAAKELSAYNLAVSGATHCQSSGPLYPSIILRAVPGYKRQSLVQVHILEQCQRQGRWPVTLTLFITQLATCVGANNTISGNL